jgi:outer membrane lipoprotein-sorting protein
MTSGRRAALSLVAALGMHCGAAAAFSAAELMQQLAAVASSHATFVETRHSALLKQPLVLRGTLAYRRPASIEKHVVEPYDERIAIDGDRLTYENSKRGRSFRTSVSGSPGLAALVEGIRATRAGDLAALEQHYQVSVSGAAERWSMTLKPADEEVARQVASITVSGGGSRISRVEVREAGGDRAVMEIREELR